MKAADIAALRALQIKREARVKANAEMNVRLKAGECVTVEMTGEALGDPLVDLGLCLTELQRLRAALTEIADGCDEIPPADRVGILQMIAMMALQDLVLTDGNRIAQRAALDGEKP